MKKYYFCVFVNKNGAYNYVPWNETDDERGAYNYVPKNDFLSRYGEVWTVAENGEDAMKMANAYITPIFERWSKMCNKSRFGYKKAKHEYDKRTKLGLKPALRLKWECSSHCEHDPEKWVNRDDIDLGGYGSSSDNNDDEDLFGLETIRKINEVVEG